MIGANHRFETMKWQFYQEKINTKRFSSRGPQSVSSVSKKTELVDIIYVHLCTKFTTNNGARKHPG